jgi:predicted DNA-binding antitoxin AbrB/MazE fold protein
MTKQIEAIFERGVLRPVEPIDVPEGERLQLIVITHRETHDNGKAATSLAEIAALPMEGQSGAFSGRDHDTVLYPKAS